METLEATYKVATPLFCSGADQRQAELRLPSIKGALRFWWRALAWQRLGDLNAIRKQEAQLFGSTDAGQAGVLMRLAPVQARSIDAGKVLQDEGRVVGEGARYLGYGVMEAFARQAKGIQAGQLTRPCLAAPFAFTLQLRLKPQLTQDQRDSLVQALKLLGTIGGLGSKARKGYGSLVLTALTGVGTAYTPPRTLDELRELLQTFKVDSPNPPYTALSSASRFIIAEGRPNDTPLALLNRIGRELVFYRSWGNHGKVFGQPSEQNFRDDHDLMKAIADGSQKPAHVTIDYPKRVAFGLPHNYFFSSIKKKADVKAALDTSAIERRASPLFIHIHTLGSRPVAVLSFLPGQFLPDGASIRMIGSQVRKDAPVDSAHDPWEPVRDFLERMQNNGSQPRLQRQESFGDVIAV